MIHKSLDSLLRAAFTSRHKVIIANGNLNIENRVRCVDLSPQEATQGYAEVINTLDRSINEHEQAAMYAKYSIGHEKRLSAAMLALSIHEKEQTINSRECLLDIVMYLYSPVDKRASIRDMMLTHSATKSSIEKDKSFIAGYLTSIEESAERKLSISLDRYIEKESALTC